MRQSVAPDDMLAIVLYGGRTSLIVGVFVTVIAMGMAIALGLLSGFYRRLEYGGS